MSPKQIEVVGAVPLTVLGPGTITHEGGDDILVAQIEGGLPQSEYSIGFEGADVQRPDGDEFHPAEESRRQMDIGEAALIRALGQANYSFEKKAAKKPAAKKEPAVA